MAERERGHWAEELAGRVLAEKKPPYVVGSGITTSGPTHLGTLCEFLFPSAVHAFLSRTHPAEFVFVADILDAFDSVPAALAEHAGELEGELGKPLAAVPDPLACHSSLGEHFLADAQAAMDAFGVRPEVLRADELYAKGRYDPYAITFLNRLEETKRIVAETSLKGVLPDWWSPLMPICKGCGRVATTRVTGFSVKGGDAEYSYACDRHDVKYARGCGRAGTARISEHAYKLTWRLDWPARQDFLGVSCEGAGVDHMTRGGSWDTARAVHERIFGKAPPVAYKFGFILFKGKKYSKSKGTGMGVAELLSLVPPELVKYALYRPDLEENIDFDPSGYNLMRLYDEFAAAARLVGRQGLSRADRKRAIAFSLSTDRLRWRAGFADALLYYQLYGDWAKVGAALGDEQGVKYLSKYIAKWVEEGYAPDEYAFSFSPTKPENRKAALAFAAALADGMSALDVHNLVFRVAAELGLKPDALFKILYRALIAKERGPRFGKLVEAIGVAKVKRTLLGLCGE
ncbi:MAG: lysine--tRNA ligase [Candidatus Micrarchaeia archaeon]